MAARVRSRSGEQRVGRRPARRPRPRAASSPVPRPESPAPPPRVQVWALLSDKDAIPKKMQPAVVQIAAVRLEDKSAQARAPPPPRPRSSRGPRLPLRPREHSRSLYQYAVSVTGPALPGRAAQRRRAADTRLRRRVQVRKSAVQLLKVLVQKNPYAPSPASRLPLPLQTHAPTHTHAHAQTHTRTRTHARSHLPHPQPLTALGAPGTRRPSRSPTSRPSSSWRPRPSASISASPTSTAGRGSAATRRTACASAT